MTSPTFSIISYCKGRLEYLKRALPTFVRQRDTEVVVVDYDCPDRAKDWIASHFPTVRVAAVTDAPIFNLSRARNIGVGLAQGTWLVFCDADMLLQPSFSDEMLRLVVPGVYLRPVRSMPTGPITLQFPLLCELASNRAVGGYDDAFRGWGGADREFVRRLNRHGAREVLYPEALVETLQHTNEARSSHYEHKIDVSMVINHHYARIKERYFETRGQWFSDEQRFATYELVEQAILASIATSQHDAMFDVRIPNSEPPWTARLSAAAVRKFHERVMGGLFRVML